MLAVDGDADREGVGHRQVDFSDAVAANERDLAAICFRQRVAVNVENRSLRSLMVGEDVAMPVALAPTGLCGMLHADAEILAARAAYRSVCRP